MEKVFVSAFDGDTKALNKIKTKCKDIWNALKEFFLKFARVINEYYSNMSPDSEAGRFVANLEQKTFSVIKEVYFEELSKALDMNKHFKGLNDVVSFLDSDGIDYSNTDLHKTKNTATEDGVKYSTKNEFAQQVDDVLNNTYDKNNHVYMGNTPQTLVNILGIKKLPMLVTNNHIYSMSVSKAKAKSEGRYKKKVNYHNLGDTVKELPKLLNKPAMIIKSNTKNDDTTFVVVTNKADTNGNPILAVIKPDGKGNYYDVELDSTVLLSAYGKDEFYNYLEKAFNDSRILYLNKNSQQTNTTGVQFPNNVLSADYSNNLAHFKQIVNNNSMQKDSKNSLRDNEYFEAVNNGDMETAQRMVDEAAKEKGYSINAYHGTRKADFTVFRRNVNYFTSNPDVAKSYAPNDETYSVYLKMQNPFVLDANNNKWSKIPISNDLVALFDTYGSSYFKEDGKIRTSVADIVAVIEEAVDEGDFDYDGVIIRNVDDTGSYYKNKNDIIADDYIVFNRNNIKSADPVTYDDNGDVIPLSERFNEENEDIRYSQRDYSYDALVSKPDMKITKVDDTISYDVNPQTRKLVVNQGVENAKLYGEVNNGAISIYVDDIESNVIVSKNSLVHGIDRRLQLSAPVIVNIGSIVKNSVLVNEMTPKKPTSSASFVLIGYAESDTHSYLVRMVVNQYTNEVDKVDVLYAINTKKEPAGKMPGSHGKTALPTGSMISISDLLDLVNKYFPDVLPENVLKHYGYDARPSGDLGDNILYQARPDFDDFIFDDFDGEVTDNDARLMTEYLRQGKTDIVNHLINQTRNIEIHDGKIRTLVSRLLKSYDLSMDSNKDVYVALMSLLESQNKSEIDENLDLLQGVLGKVVRESSYISESDRKFRDEINEFLKDYRKEYAVYLNDEQISSIEFQGRTIKWLRNKLAGSVNIVKEDADTKHKKTSFGYFMHTMAENFPEYFSMANVDAVDSWETFIDKMDKINNPTDMGVENAYGMSEDEFVSELTARMIADVVESKYNSKKNAYVADLVKKLRKDHNRRVREVRTRARQRVKEAEQKKYDKLIEKHKEQRERYKEGRNKTAIKGKIRNAFKNIDSYLNHGNKKKNVKEGMRDFASKALELADIIFENNISNEDIIRRGVVGLSEREQKYYDLYQKQLQLRDIKEEQYEKIRDTASLQTIQQVRGEISQIDSKLKYYDQQLKDMFAREKAKIYQMPVQDAINALADAYSELRDSKYSYVSDAFDEDVLNMITELKDSIGKGTRVKDMTVNQLNEIYKAATAVLTTIRNANKLFGVENTVSQISETALLEFDKIRDTKETQSLISKTLGDYGFNSLKPIYAMRLLGSKTFENLFWNLQKGELKWYQNLEKIKAFRDEIAKRHNYKSWDFKKMYSFTDVHGKSFEINLEQLMSIYALSQRPQGREHLLRDGFVSDEIKITGDKKKGYKISYKNGGVAHSMDVDILAKMSGELTDEQRAYVKEMQKFLSSDIAELGNEVSMSLYGIRQFEEPVYFPIKVAKDFLPTDYSNKNADAVMKNRGFTHKTVKNAGQPLILGEFSTTWANHCDEMAQYNALVLPLEDISKVLNYRTSSLMSGGPANSLKQQISGKWGKAALDYIETLIRDINGGVRVSGVKFADKLISLSKKASVFASMSVVIQQPFAFARAMAYVNPKYFGKTVTKSFNLAKHNKDWAELKKYAPVAGIKEMGYFDTGIGRKTTDWILQDEYEGVGEKTKAFFVDGNYRDEIFSKFPAVADEIAWVLIWHAVKAEIRDTTELTGEELLQRCGERFNEVVQLTQVYDSVFSRSGFMRNKDTFSKMATAFMAEPTVTLNMNVDAIVQGKRIGGSKGIKTASGIICSVLASQVLTALAKSAWTAGRDDDEDKTYGEKYLNTALHELWDNIMPWNQMVLVRDIVSLVEGYDVKRMDMNVFAEIVKSTEKLAEAIADEEKEVTFDLILNAIGSYSNMFGLPVRNVIRDFKTAINLFGISSGSDSVSAKSAVNQYFDGDASSFKTTVDALVKEKYDEYYAQGETENDAEKKAKQSVRAYFTREYKELYLEAFYGGNTAEASKIKSMLYNTGLYGSVAELTKTLADWKESYRKE